MHITSGRLKGKKLANCKSRSIRPAMALVRKSIFDTIGNLIEEAYVLDLCAGSGSLGIEALSRGAKSLTLVDSTKEAIRLIKKNLELCNLKANVIFGRLPRILGKKSLFEEGKSKFDLIFLDPPYGNSEFIEKVLEVIIKKKLLSTEGIILIETEDKADYSIPEELNVYKIKRFGNTKVTYLKYVIGL